MLFSKKLPLLTAILSASIPLFAQYNFCNLFKDEVLKQVNSTYGIDEGVVQGIVYEIMNAHHIATNILVFSDKNIDNVKAGVKVMDGLEHRVIYYNPNFVKGLELTFNKWCIYSAFAHEIGHCVNADFLNGGITSQTKEIQADRFSGVTLRLLKAPSLQEAISYMASLAEEESSLSHPPKKERIDALTAGWNSVKLPGEGGETGGSGPTGNDALYEQRVKEGDALFEKKDYERATLKFEEAAKIDPDQTYPQAMIDKINSVWKKYDKLISEAEDYYLDDKYDLAKSKIEQAKNLIPNEDVSDHTSFYEDIMDAEDTNEQPATRSEQSNEPVAFYIQYTGDRAGCLLSISIRMNGKTIRPTGINFRVSNIPEGTYPYTISGNINCSTGRCIAEGNGTVDVYEGATLQVGWVNDFGQHCSVGLVNY